MSWEDDVQEHLAAGFAAWGGAVSAFSSAMVGIWAQLVDLAVDEVVVAPPNAAAVPVHSRQPTFLHARAWRATDVPKPPRRPTFLPADRVHCEPRAVAGMAPGQTSWVVVHLDPGGPDDLPRLADEGYLVELLDDHGEVLTDVPVYVPLHLPWAP